MKYRFTGLFLAAFIAALANTTINTETAMSQERPAVARYGKAYKGYEGLRVSVSPLADMKRAMVMMSGINHPWDRLIFMCEITLVKSNVNPRTEYRTKTPDGDGFFLLTTPEGNGELYVKGEQNPLKVFYDEGYSGEINNEHVLTAYLEQEDKARAAKRKK